MFFSEQQPWLPGTALPLLPAPELLAQFPRGRELYFFYRGFLLSYAGSGFFFNKKATVWLYNGLKMLKYLFLPALVG
jgi:hypothetical protein